MERKKTTKNSALDNKKITPNLIVMKALKKPLLNNI